MNPSLMGLVIFEERFGMVRALFGVRSVPALLIAMAILLAGCVSRPQESAEYRDVVPMDAVERSNPAVKPAGEFGYQDPDGVFNILALSSGGAYGAYGAGVLTGWTESGNRPQFDIVTGVSTGALMSVFAFLGPQHDPLLKELYTNVTNADIYRERGIVGVFSDSLYDNSPLKKEIERVITPQVIKAVAAEHAKGRRLYVATTNLDSGDLVVWDMGQIASGGRTDPVQHFRKVLRASASIPAFFKPVYIKPRRGVQLRQAHVDGGVRSPVLITDFLFRTKSKRRNLYVVINDSIAERDSYAAVEPNLGSIARKTISTLTRQLMVQNVYRGYVRAVNSNTKFFLTAVPDELGTNTTSLQFDPKKMRQLFTAGRNNALSANPWLSRPPSIQSFDILAAKRK